MWRKIVAAHQKKKIPYYYIESCTELLHPNWSGFSWIYNQLKEIAKLKPHDVLAEKTQLPFHLLVTE